MKKTRGVSVIVMSILLIIVTFAISGHAKKPPSPPGLFEPTIVSLTGAIEGTGAFANIAITLKNEFQGYGYDIYSGTYYYEYGSFIANPDYPPALSISGTPKNKNLSYYYCDSDDSPHDAIDGICADPDHDPENYKRLRILGGVLDRKTGNIVWPVGSEWRIGWKKIQDDGNGGRLLVGYLQEEVIYSVVE